MAGRGTAGGGPMKPGRMGHTPTSLAAGFAITASPGPGGPSRQAARPVIPLTARPDNGGAGPMQRHRQVPSRRAAAPGQTAVRSHCRSRGPGLRGRAGPAGRDLYRVSAGRTGSVTRHPQARPRPARRFVPSAGRDLVAGRVVLLEAEPAGWTWQQGPGQRASPAGGTGPGSRRSQRQPDGAGGASEASPASETFMLMEPQLV